MDSAASAVFSRPRPWLGYLAIRWQSPEGGRPEWACIWGCQSRIVETAQFGWVPEWSNGLAWKACVPHKGTEGSNPSPSAIVSFARKIWLRSKSLSHWNPDRAHRALKNLLSLCPVPVWSARVHALRPIYRVGCRRLINRLFPHNLTPRPQPNRQPTSPSGLFYRGCSAAPSVPNLECFHPAVVSSSVGPFSCS